MRPTTLTPHHDEHREMSSIFMTCLKSTRFGAMVSSVLMAVILISAGALMQRQVIHAQESSEFQARGPLSFADRKVGVINQLRSLNVSLREIRLRVDPKLPLKDEELTQLLHEASLGQQMGQSLELSFRSIHALQRRDASSLNAYPQLLMTLSESLLGINLSREGFARLRKILEKAKSTPRNYERAMIALFERGRGTLSADELIKHWDRYLELCRGLRRPPSASAHYVFAKALYFARAYSRAERELQEVIQQQGYQARAMYILGVIKLIDEDWDEAVKLLSELKRQIDAYLKRPPPATSESRPPAVKIVPTDSPRLKVEQVIEETPTKPQTKVRSSSSLRASEGLAEDLRALLDEVNAEERLTRVTTKRLGSAPAAEDLMSLRDLQAVLAMALARVSLLRGEYAEAWQHYRAVPIGSPLYQEALLEIAYMFKVRREYIRCADTLNLALRAYPNSEAKFELRLWKAEMLGRARKTLRVNLLYKVMKRDLARQVSLLEGAAESKVLFAPEVVAWLPAETKLRGQKLSQRLRELEIWLGQARQDLTALQAASEAKRYPMIEVGSAQVTRALTQLERLSLRLPRLINLWRQKPQERDDENVIEVNRGAQVNERAFASVNPNEISEAVKQLQQRALAVREELKRRESIYRARLAERLAVETKLVASAERKLSKLRAEVTQLSESGRTLALKRVRGFQAQLELGPILSSFWLKENATDQLRRARDLALADRKPLKDLKAQEDSRPQGLDILDILDPAIKSYIVDPLPDPERDRN